MTIMSIQDLDMVALAVYAAAIIGSGLGAGMVGNFVNCITGTEMGGPIKLAVFIAFLSACVWALSFFDPILW